MFGKYTLRALFLCVLSLTFPIWISAQSTVHQELQEIVKAEVVRVLDVTTREITGTDTTVTLQTSEARVLHGTAQGRIVSFENEFVILERGDIVYLNHLVMIDGSEVYAFKDVNRMHEIIILGILFVGLTIVFAGRQGVRAISSLGVSILAIVFLLVPALLKGYDPTLMSLLIAGLILGVVLFGTHGINARSSIAFFGTFSSVLVTCLLAWFFVHSMRLTGFSSDASVYLNFSTGGTLNFADLLLGSIIIGILGILDDVSITQASVVQELKAANPLFGLRELYTRAIRVGRDHVGSLVNTLALAYVGASLPLVLLFARASSDIGLTLNQEVFAAEFVRIVVGSIGLILAVPLTTLVAAWWFSTHASTQHTDDGHRHF